MSGRLRRRRRDPGEQDLNVTAFMNLMVVLVPFLLLMVVFSRMTVLELNLPKEGAPGAANEPPLQLEVVLRADRLELNDHGRLLKRLPNRDGAYDLAALSDVLADLKAAAPAVTEATLLLEPQIKYDHLVAVMDRVRVRIEAQTKTELFPDISIGDAPARAGGG